MTHPINRHPRWKTTVTGLLGTLVLVCSAAHAAAEEKTDVKTLKTPEIVITATRTERELQKVPSSISVVTAEDMTRSDATTLADLLQDVPGVEVFDQSIAGAKRVQIRGESGARVLVLIDGQKISEQKSMDGAALLIDPDRVERIEVIKGPASVLYGSEAIGGVVNLITKKGGTRPVQAELRTTYDTSADGVNGYASVFGGLDGFSYRLSGTRTDYGDRRTPDRTLDNSSYETREFSAFGGYDIDRMSIGVLYDRYQSDIDSHTPEGTTGGTLTYFQLDLPRWDREKISAYAELRDVGDSIPRMRLDVYFQNTRKLFKNDMNLSIPISPPFRNMIIENRITTDNDQDAFGSGFQMDWTPHHAHYLIFGYEPVFDRLDAATTTVSRQDSPMPPPSGTQTESTEHSIYDAAMDTHAVFLQDEWTLPSNLTATLGVRQTWLRSELKDTTEPSLEKGSTDDSYPVFSAGLTYDGVDNLVLRGLFSRGYRFPNLQQLFIGTVHGSADPTFPNPDLEPETSSNYEIGARFDNSAWVADITGFYSDAADYISTAPVTGGRRFVNVDTAETYGAELTLGYTFPGLGLTPYASATWLKRKFTRDGSSTYDTGLPELKGRTGLRYEQLFRGHIDFYSDIYARWAAKAEEQLSDGTRETHGSWETLNLTLGARFGRQQQYFTTLNLNNIFDRSYATARSTLDQPGFHAVIKAGVTF
jgi:hemoglobin/transferrin/lactoferrin receptor protein